MTRRVTSSSQSSTSLKENNSNESSLRFHFSQKTLRQSLLLHNNNADRSFYNLTLNKTMISLMFLLVFFGENISSQFCQRNSDVGLLAVPQRRTRDNEWPPFQPSKNQFRFHQRSSSSSFSYLDLLSAFKIKF